tara:strand:+ start:551 stop:964 length:414 start_codon:yes stop_codon:yes gene_type:complete
MATRAMISIAKREEGVSFSEEPNKTIVDIYHHWDGYPEGLGVTLASYLDGKKVTNGLSDRNDHSVFNGMGCLAASLVAELKDGPGDVYIEPRNSHGWIDYQYYIWGDTYKDIWISIFENDECIFVGLPTQLLDKYED